MKGDGASFWWKLAGHGQREGENLMRAIQRNHLTTMTGKTLSKVRQKKNGRPWKESSEKEGGGLIGW